MIACKKVFVYKDHKSQSWIFAFFRMDECYCWLTEVWLDCSLMLTESEKWEGEYEIHSELINVIVFIDFWSIVCSSGCKIWFDIPEFPEKSCYLLCQIICSHLWFMQNTYSSCSPLIKNKTIPVLPCKCNQRIISLV